MDKYPYALPESFESLSKTIIQYLLRGADAHITQTRSNKDGGYDIVVECCSEYGIRRAFFECKLRKGNLNLRDVAANVIIAFNHGAAALVAVTNHDFTQQTGNELLSFRNNTILNVKIIVGEEINQLAEECGVPIEADLRKYLNFKKTNRQDEFRVLRFDLNENILNQLFDQRCTHHTQIDPATDDIYHDEIAKLVSSIHAGALVAVSGYLGVGKHQLICNSLAKVAKQALYIDATLYMTKDLVVLDLLAQIWGIPATDVFDSFSQNDIQSITEYVGDARTESDTVEMLTALLNERYCNKRTSARQNVLLCEYISSLLVLHSRDIGYVVYIKKLQFASKEIYDFLLYFAKHLAKLSIACIISYQVPEYKLQEGKNPLATLQYIDGYQEHRIQVLSDRIAETYIRKRFPELPSHIAKLLVTRVGTRIYNLSALTCHLLPNTSILPANSKEITRKLELITPNNIPNLISFLLPKYREDYSMLFEACFIFECRLSLTLYELLGLSINDLNELENAGIFSCDYGTVLPRNEFVYEWIMNAYSISSSIIQLRAKTILNLINNQQTPYITERICLFRITGRWREALELLDADILRLKRDKQYSLLRTELNTAVELASSLHDHTKEADYLISLLELMTIQKEIGSKEAERYLLRLANYAKCNGVSEQYRFALSYFQLKRAFKQGSYTDESDKSLELGKTYFDACLRGELTDNSGDWLGKICSCFALLIKETEGNENALVVFKRALSVLPTSFELRREYFSHIACMELYDKPMEAFHNYKKILTLFKNEAPESAALPFHEYGDLAMSQLMAKNYANAIILANDAIAIVQSNGLIDEEGRCLNIRGCAEWCLGNLSIAEESFREATAIMCHSDYLHYAWRSQINLLQISNQTGTYIDSRLNMLEKLYADFKNLLQGKIQFLARLDSVVFRKTREYHALLALGVLWTRIGKNRNGFNVICKDFRIGTHELQFQNDLNSFLYGTYDFMDSPYIQNGYIYFVG